MRNMSQKMVKHDTIPFRKPRKMTQSGFFLELTSRIALGGVMGVLFTRADRDSIQQSLPLMLSHFDGDCPPKREEYVREG